MFFWIFVAFAGLVAGLEAAGVGSARVVCYVEGRTLDSMPECTHLVYTGPARGDKLDAVLKEYKKTNPNTKIMLRVFNDDKDIRTILKTKHVQGIEVFEAHKTLNRTKIVSTLEAARAAVKATGGNPLFLALPANPELLAKYYDLRALLKVVDLMTVHTHALGLVKGMTYHPSRLSGLWDMMNTDSVVDLVVGLGVPASKIVISLPATARQFTLRNDTLSTPGSPTVEDEPKEINQTELCTFLGQGGWTLERDQDLSAPYAFKNKTWISFEDSSSVDVKGKYARVRGLAGLALHQAERDAATPCAPALRTAISKVLSQQSRAPRAAVLRSLEHEILSLGGHATALDALQQSPYRITQVVDSDGVIHSIREDTRTEFSCSRQGYFVHPRSCARFYRCVKFDQLSPEYTVFEFDCPAGLAFDSRYEVCVWPGSLAHSQACPGSSEIAPVPQTRFVCPGHEGYYADPENCRWFFACIDHGKAPLSAYEFRCPFGLGFDADKLKCDWPWLVPSCGNIARYEAEAFGFSAATLTGAAGFHGQTADDVNIAAHQSLLSGASLDNVVGIQSGYLSQADALDGNFIASQHIANGALGHSSSITENNRYSGLVAGPGLVKTTTYDDDRYRSGSLILDEYRLPSATAGQNAANAFYNSQSQQYSLNSENLHNSEVSDDSSGTYVHDPTGDYAEPYKHEHSPAVPYIHENSPYKLSKDYNAYGEHQASVVSQLYNNDNNGQYVNDNSGAYYKSNGNEAYSADQGGSYNAGYSGSYINDDAGKYIAGIYRSDGDASVNSANIQQYRDSYSNANNNQYLSNANAYDGISHNLAAGAVNVGLVGKTTLVDGDYLDRNSYYNSLSASSRSQSYNQGVSVTHLGSDVNRLHGDGISYVTTPTSSGIPTTVTPIAVTTAIPVTGYRTTYVQEQPRSNVKEIFGYSQPTITQVRPVLIAANQYVSPKIDVTNHNQGIDYQSYSAQQNNNIGIVATDDSAIKTESSGYNYPKPAVKFEDGVITQTTAAPDYVQPIVPAYIPKAFSQQTIHNNYKYSASAVTEEPFKKIVAYTTGEPSVFAYEQPTISSPTPHSFSHQTIHKVDAGNVNAYIPTISDAAYQNQKPDIQLYKIPQAVEYTTVQPALAVDYLPVVSTYKPEVYNQNTVHNVKVSHGNTYVPSLQISNAGYDYPQPVNQYDQDAKTIVTYASRQPAIALEPLPEVSTYSPRIYDQQIIHKVDSSDINVGYDYPKPTNQFNEGSKTIVEYTTAQPAIALNPLPAIQTYSPQVYDHQIVHKVESSHVNTYNPLEISKVGYEYPKPLNQFNEPAKAIVEYSYEQTASPPVVSTYKPQTYQQETVHNVQISQDNTGYEYPKPVVKYDNPPQVPSIQSGPTVSTYNPHSYSHQTIHKVEEQQFIPISSTPTPNIEINYQRNPVTRYENPIEQYIHKTQTDISPQPESVYVQTYRPLVHQQQVNHATASEYQPLQENVYEGQNVQINQQAYSYPEIQRNPQHETFNTGGSYSQSRATSHQVYHQTAEETYGKENKNIVFVSTTPATLAYEDHYAEYEAPKKVNTYKAPEYVPPKNEYVTPQPIPITTPLQQTQDSYEYEPIKYSNNYDIIQNPIAPIQQISFSTTHERGNNLEESIGAGSYPTVSVSSTYSPISYNDAEIQVGYKAEEYLPPVVSSPKPTVTTTYTQQTYLPPTSSSRDYLPPISSSRDYLPPTSSSSRDYLPPISSSSRDYLPPISSSSRDYLPPTRGRKLTTPKTVTSTYLPPSTTTKPVFKSTTYKAPEYLPPINVVDEPQVVNFEYFGLKNNDNKPLQDYSINDDDEYVPSVVSTSSAPLIRQQNIVVETSKSNLLGFGTVGPDAGLVSSAIYTTSAPTAPVQYSTYTPIKQEFIEVTPSPIPARRTKPKVAVVTKINDFNPFLVRKLGAVCSCQSPILVLKGKRPNVRNGQDYDVNYDSSDYDDSGRGDISDIDVVPQRTRERVRAKAKAVTLSPVVTTSFNPIIVPDDSYYQDYLDAGDVPTQSKEIYSENFISSTPPSVSLSTENIVNIKPRTQSVTIAPTYRTVLLEDNDKPEPTVKVVLETRGRENSLQASINCQRAGLFRHPKQCNKFYACRWDCTKQKFTLHVFNCPVQLSFDPTLGACNWPSQGPSCQGDTLLTNTL